MLVPFDVAVMTVTGPDVKPNFRKVVDYADAEQLEHVAEEIAESLKSMVDMMDSGDEHGSGSLWHKEATAALASYKRLKGKV